jgi:AraC family transcriptional regulator of adaptative response/methylated-DNA-[protein]-cysteine methyltransferase
MNKQNEIHQQVLTIFSKDWNDIKKIKLHLKGTPFQLKVWETLLKIPTGNLTSYGEIAKNMETPNASRAVGTAIGANPIAFLIPCHRVIQTTGNFGGYRWGNTRKTAIIGWEAASK